MLNFYRNIIGSDKYFLLQIIFFVFFEGFFYFFFVTFIKKVMQYSPELIDKIYNYKSISDNEKINRLLEIDATQYTNCGLETTKSEKAIVKKNSKYIYKTIYKINSTIGKSFLEHQDK